MSNQMNVNHDAISDHLAKVNLEPNDFAILGVRPTSNKAWFQVAVAQHVPRSGDLGSTVRSEGRLVFGRGKGDPNWGQSKARRHWDTLTLEDIQEKYKDVPAVIQAAKKSVEANDYVLVSDEEGNPIVNPMYVDTDGTKYPFVLDIWEDHMVETEWDVSNITSSAKQDGNGNYLFVNYNGELVDGNFVGGQNYAIFTHYAVNVGKAHRDMKKHHGAVQNVRDLKIKTPDTTGGISGLPGIAESADEAQKTNKQLDGSEEPNTVTQPQAG